MRHNKGEKMTPQYAARRTESSSRDNSAARRTNNSSTKNTPAVDHHPAAGNVDSAPSPKHRPSEALLNPRKVVNAQKSRKQSLRKSIAAQVSTRMSKAMTPRRGTSENQLTRRNQRSLLTMSRIMKEKRPQPRKQPRLP